MSEAIIADAVREHARARLADHLAQVRRCVALLTSDEVWYRANDHTNSIGNLVLHVRGNLHQWMLAGLGGAPLQRDRAAEFAERGPRPTPEIVAALDAAVTAARDVLARLDAGALARRYSIQGYDVAGVVAVCHAVEHLANHTGQIVQMTKVLKNVDLSIYDEAGHKREGFSAAP